jgi:hypothetical protein
MPTARIKAEEDMHDHSIWHTIYLFISGPALLSYKVASKTAVWQFVKFSNFYESDYIVTLDPSLCWDQTKIS